MRPATSSARRKASCCWQICGSSGSPRTATSDPPVFFRAGGFWLFGAGAPTVELSAGGHGRRWAPVRTPVTVPPPAPARETPRRKPSHLPRTGTSRRDPDARKPPNTRSRRPSGSKGRAGARTSDVEPEWRAWRRMKKRSRRWWAFQRVRSCAPQLWSREPRANQNQRLGTRFCNGLHRRNRGHGVGPRRRRKN